MDDERLIRSNREAVESDDRTRRHTFRAEAMRISIQTILFALLLILGDNAWHSLADRVDRNLAYDVCILAVHPDVRSADDYLRCYKYADSLYPGLKPPLPTPVLTPLLPTEGNE